MLRKSLTCFWLAVLLSAMTFVVGCASFKASEDAPAVSQQPAAPTAFVHTVKPGESIPSVLRSYISDTSYITVAELEPAFREANQKPKGVNLKPGEQVVIPGYLFEPIVEKPVPLPKGAEVRAIYLTGTMAGSARGIDKIRRWRELGGNSVVFDIKDSDGSISIPFDHPLAPKNKNVPIPNLAKFVRFLHSMQIHAIARIALFRDDNIARHHGELAVQSKRNKQPWRENGKLVWTDPSRREVQDYNLALAKAAAAAGVDEVQFDYVRFPAEGDQRDAQFAFMKQRPPITRADVITSFLERAHAELRPMGVLLSLDVFGVMAWQRSVDLAHTGQDIVRLAAHCDVLSPMIYPSHFFGMDGYARPGDAPEHFIGTSMERFGKVTAGSGVVLRPWLQAFRWRTPTYSPKYIQAEVRAAKEKGGVGFLFWNAGNDYSKPFAAMPLMRADATRYFRDPELLTAAQHFKTKDHANTTSTGPASQPAVSPSERPAQSADTSQVYPPSH
jgi:hypothetical protein